MQCKCNLTSQRSQGPPGPCSPYRRSKTYTPSDSPSCEPGSSSTLVVPASCGSSRRYTAPPSSCRRQVERPRESQPKKKIRRNPIRLLETPASRKLSFRDTSVVQELSSCSTSPRHGWLKYDQRTRGMCPRGSSLAWFQPGTPFCFRPRANGYGLREALSPKSYP